MSSVQSRIGSELLYVYVILRRLKAIRRAEFDQGSKTKGSEVTLFPREFLINLLEERLAAVERFGDELAARWFERLANKKTKQLAGESNITLIRSNTLKSNCLELDEYFHYSLYYLHDFIIELDWHESSLNWSILNLYESSGLGRVKGFVGFRKAIDDHVRKLRITNDLNASKQKSSPKSNSDAGPLKSSLSNSKLAGPRRRVRFWDSSTNESKESQDLLSDKECRNAQSLFALDLLLYSMRSFISQLCKKLIHFTARADDVSYALAQIIDSKKKINTTQLSVISRKIKDSYDARLTLLDYLFDLRKTYMIDYVLNVLCAQESDVSLNSSKANRVGLEVHNIEFSFEPNLIECLANQSFQLLIDLVNSEIGLPPVELDAETETKSREDVVRSRENYSNFITSWLNIDDMIFGSAKPDRQTNAVDLRQTKQSQEKLAKHSTLATGGRFKSSSRILAQMDNLNELAKDIFEHILNRLHSVQQIKFFLELVHLGFEESFDIISSQIFSHLLSLRQNRVKKNSPKTGLNDFSAVANSVDLITAKVRSLKLIHIMSSVDKLIKEMAAQKKIELSERLLDSKLTKFIDQCEQHNFNSN